MGVVGSKIYSYGKKLAIRYNCEERAHKLIEKGNLPPAPRHDTRGHKEVPLSREALEDIHCKDIQLNEYLKKVYLTSTSQVTGTPSKRPKPKKENEARKKTMFYEPETPAPGHCTLTNVLQILLNFNPDSDQWSVDAISKKFNMDKEDVVHLVSYYSLFRHEQFDMMNYRPKETDKFEFETLEKLEMQPLKKIDSK